MNDPKITSKTTTERTLVIHEKQLIRLLMERFGLAPADDVFLRVESKEFAGDGFRAVATLTMRNYGTPPPAGAFDFNDLWVVPMIPTEEMRIAGNRSIDEDRREVDAAIRDEAYGCYMAMIEEWVNRQP